jgi:hypothetical protein
LRTENSPPESGCAVQIGKRIWHIPLLKGEGGPRQRAG